MVSKRTIPKHLLASKNKHLNQVFFDFLQSIVWQLLRGEHFRLSNWSILSIGYIGQAADVTEKEEVCFWYGHWNHKLTWVDLPQTIRCKFAQPPTMRSKTQKCRKENSSQTLSWRTFLSMFPKTCFFTQKLEGLCISQLTFYFYTNYPNCLFAMIK